MKGRGGLKLADWENGEARLSRPGLPSSNRLNLPSLFSLSVIPIHTIPSYNRQSLSSRKVKSTFSVLYLSSLSSHSFLATGKIYHLCPLTLVHLVSHLRQCQFSPHTLTFAKSAVSILTTNQIYPHPHTPFLQQVLRHYFA